MRLAALAHSFIGLIRPYWYMVTRAETIHRGFAFVRFVLLDSEFELFSVFLVQSVFSF